MKGHHLSRRNALRIAGAAAVPGILVALNPPAHADDKRQDDNGQENPAAKNNKELSMNLGAFSVSLAVKDLKASQEFYEKFGFKPFAGNAKQNWLILRNGDHVIGLFQGMFEKNILTFNPGWDQNAQKVGQFTDIRELQRRLKAQGVQLVTEADESTIGPASFSAVDPDGNTILVDQHV